MPLVYNELRRLAASRLARERPEQIPSFKDLESANKRHVMLEAGHNPPTNEAFAAADSRLRQLFGDKED